MKSDSDLRQFVCPACNQTIFNRRHPVCERCGAAIPQELLYTKEQLEAHAEDSARIEKNRKERLERKQQQYSDYEWFGD